MLSGEGAGGAGGAGGFDPIVGRRGSPSKWARVSMAVVGGAALCGALVAVGSGGGGVGGGGSGGGAGTQLLSVPPAFTNTEEKVLKGGKASTVDIIKQALGAAGDVHQAAAPSPVVVAAAAAAAAPRGGGQQRQSQLWHIGHPEGPVSHTGAERPVEESRSRREMSAGRGQQRMAEDAQSRGGEGMGVQAGGGYGGDDDDDDDDDDDGRQHVDSAFAAAKMFENGLRKWLEDDRKGKGSLDARSRREDLADEGLGGFGLGLGDDGGERVWDEVAQEKRALSTLGKSQGDSGEREEEAGNGGAGEGGKEGDVKEGEGEGGRAEDGVEDEEGEGGVEKDDEGKHFWDNALSRVSEMLGKRMGGGAAHGDDDGVEGLLNGAGHMEGAIHDEEGEGEGEGEGAKNVVGGRSVVESVKREGGVERELVADAAHGNMEGAAVGDDYYFPRWYQ